jgi:glycosyltransferase involved in cell wall biosynthesis
MKVAYISSAAFSDVDISYINQAQELFDIDYYIIIGARNKRSNAIDLRGVDLKDGVTSAVTIPFFEKFRKLVNLEKTFVIYNSILKGYSLFSIWNNYRVYKFLRSKKYDVVHITSAPSYNNFFYYFFGKRLILTVHDPIRHSSATRKVEEFNRKRAFKNIKNLILLNNNQKSEFIETYKIPPRTQIYNSSLSSYDYLNIYDKELRFKDCGRYILFFGNVVSYKGLEYLFPAMVRLHEEYPEVSIVVAGKGEYYFDISEYEHLDYFKIINDFIPDDKLASLIRNCAFVVIPYIDATQSGVTMSAYAFCKPCIATDVGGLPEMVINNKYGIIVPPKNIDGLAKAMATLIGNTELIDKFSKNIESDYKNGDKSWRSIANEMKLIYQQVINDSSK